jgi:hypothetical protein
VSPGGSVVVWPGEGATAMAVEFDARGKVYGVAFLEDGVPKPTVKDRVARWLGL